jgi:hypothetical protein
VIKYIIVNGMDTEAHFHSLSLEFEALKDRVKNIIDDAHWQTVGEWRESILRAVLRRHLPDTVRVGRGFITDGNRRSTQVEVLIYDAATPLLYREEDLVIVTPDAVRGIIEVKSLVRRGDVRDAVKKLAANSLVATHQAQGHYRPPAILGLFAYGLDDVTESASWVLRELQSCASECEGHLVKQLCFGPSYFVHLWHQEPGVWASSGYDMWHLYDLRKMSPGYFVNNVIEHVASNSVYQNRDAWFPREGKEGFLIDKMRIWPEDAIVSKAARVPRIPVARPKKL